MEEIERAAAAIRAGELVIVPTETVYGLAADATSEAAVERIFRAKGRPATNPLIVHIDSTARLADVAGELPEAIWPLVAAFWPGPLTFVVPKGAAIPSNVTAGGETVAVRMPNHHLALALIAESGRPLAAPSANRSEALSPTRLEDVDPSILLSAAFALDGGPCEVGIESTVLDMTGPSPAILRPGAVTMLMIERVLGEPLEPPSFAGAVLRSPGGHHRHYAPKTPVRIVHKAVGTEPGLVFGAPLSNDQVAMPDDPALYARRLYGTLAQMDRGGFAEIAIELPPNEPAWAAVLDRLRKMSAD